MALETHKKTHKSKYLVYIDLNIRHLNRLIMIKKIASHTQMCISFPIEDSWRGVTRKLQGLRCKLNNRGKKSD